PLRQVRGEHAGGEEAAENAEGKARARQNDEVDRSHGQAPQAAPAGAPTAATRASAQARSPSAGAARGRRTPTKSAPSADSVRTSSAVSASRATAGTTNTSVHQAIISRCASRASSGSAAPVIRPNAT